MIEDDYVFIFDAVHDWNKSEVLNPLWVEIGDKISAVRIANFLRRQVYRVRLVEAANGHWLLEITHA